MSSEGYTGWSGTLAAPAPAVRRTTPRHGKIPWTISCNTEANTKVYDFNQRMMQALNNLALIGATFEQAVANLEVEISMGNLLFNRTWSVCNVNRRASKKVSTWPSWM